MATLDIFINDFEDKLTCPICDSIFTSPKTLPCLHSFCTHCIAHWYETSGEDQVTNQLNCPTCKTAIDVPDGDPTKLRSSFYLHSLLQLLHGMKGNANQPGLPDCVSCEKSQVLVAFCPQCDGSICAECVTIHKSIKQLRDKHQPAKFVEFSEENIRSFIESKMVCKEKSHEEEKLEYFCQEQDCRRFVLQSLEEAAQDTIKDIQESINRAKQGLKETYEEEQVKFKEIMEQSRQNIESAKKEFHLAEEMICEMVRDLTTAMSSGLDQTLQKQTRANNQEQIEQLSLFMQHWQELQDIRIPYEILESKADHKTICKTLLETPRFLTSGHSDQRDMTRRYMPVHQVMQLVITKIVRTVMTVPSNCTLVSLEKVFLSFENDFCIITRNAEGEECPTRIESIDVTIIDAEGNDVEKKVSEETPGKYRVSFKARKSGPHEIQVNIDGKPIKDSPQKVDVKEMFKPVRIFGKKGCGRGELNSPQSIAVSENGEIAIADGLNNRIQIFSLDGTFLRDFGSKGEGEDHLYIPCRVAFSEDRIIIIDGWHDDIKLKECDLNGTHIRTLDRLENEVVVGYGICCDDETNITVCYSGNEQLEIESSIKILSNQGVLVDQFDMPEWEQPRYITYGNGKYFVSYHDKHYVSVFDKKGNFLYRFGERGTRDGQFPDDFGGLAVFRTDVILVCDADNHRVHLFTQDGQFKGSFGSFGTSIGQMNQPIDVIATDDGLVYVLEFESSQVQVWKFVD